MSRYCLAIACAFAMLFLVLYLRADGKLAECQAALRAQHPPRAVKWRPTPPRKVTVQMPDGSVYVTEESFIDMSWLRMPADPENEAPAMPARDDEPAILPPAVPDAATLTPIAPASSAGAGSRAWLVGLAGGYAGKWTGGVAGGYAWSRAWGTVTLGPGLALATVGGRF